MWSECVGVGEYVGVSECVVGGFVCAGGSECVCVVCVCKKEALSDVLTHTLAHSRTHSPSLASGSSSGVVCVTRRRSSLAR